MNSIPQIFDNKKIRQHRNRAAKNIDEHSFLLNEVADRITERLNDLSESFTDILNLGHTSSHLEHKLNKQFNPEILVNQDSSFALLDSKKSITANAEQMPFKDESFDLVVSNLILHFINDLPGSLLQIRKTLKKDGAFVASIYGGETLNELRQVMAAIESEEYNSSSPRVAPFIDIKTLGGLVQRAGFSDPVIDSDIMKASYDNAIDLMHDLRNMGESGPFAKTGRPLNKNMIAKISKRYEEEFGDGEDGIIATFEVINITAFA